MMTFAKIEKGLYSLEGSPFFTLRTLKGTIRRVKRGWIIRFDDRDKVQAKTLRECKAWFFINKLTS